ncbi:MAG: hypothetical protein M0R80_25810 [Proteobacteria bacterium]|jgi:hypothetical protein|nr:hypothetical protein [Pseudomonadota bacterium]
MPKKKVKKHPAKKTTTLEEEMELAQIFIEDARLAKDKDACNSALLLSIATSLHTLCKIMSGEISVAIPWAIPVDVSEPLEVRLQD